MAQIQLSKNIIKMFDSVQINGIDYKTEETAVSPSAQQILDENRESAQTVLQSSIEQEIGQEVKAVELNETLHNVKDELARNNILKEVSTRTREITRVEGLIESEVSTRTREITRVEGLIESEASTRASEITRVDGLIESEVSTRASEITRVEGLIESEVSTRASTDATLNNNINTINSKIPSQASKTNQLADKDFVNSSIATNTANFIGTFTDIEELKRQPATNNDYAFWLTTDSAGNILFKRYKYIASTNSWVFEYDLNNSSFTSEQWLAIQSGITAVLVAKLKGIEEGAQVNTITGVKGGNESSYRTGNVNITKDNVGLGNVGNFKAVSTVASQRLTDTEKSNARTNIGAGTSSFSGSYNDLTNKPSSFTPSSHTHDYLPLSGGAMTGNIKYKGSKNTCDAIKFIDNTIDISGNGISIGAGGLTIIGGGESSDVVAAQQTSGGDEKMIIANDQEIDFYTNTQEGFSSAKHITMNTDGTITADGFNGTATKATEVLDYANTSGTIKVGYSGPSIKNNDLLALAGYTERTDSSVKLKDVNKTELAKWLGLGSAPYINTLDIAISSEVSVTMNTFTSSAINAPVATDGLVITHHLSSTKATQLALCGAQLFTRTYSNSTWSAWVAMWNTEES